MIQSWTTLMAFPLAFRRSVSFPRGTRVTYVTWDGSCVLSFWFSELCSVDQTVTVQRGSWMCAGCEGSRVIFPALLLTLDEYSSWRVGRVGPMRSNNFIPIPDSSQGAIAWPVEVCSSFHCLRRLPLTHHQTGHTEQ